LEYRKVYHTGIASHGNENLCHNAWVYQTSRYRVQYTHVRPLGCTFEAKVQPSTQGFHGNCGLLALR